MFSGFSEKTTEFLWGIRFNNNKEWFLEHKETYFEQLQLPMRELANDVWQVMTEDFKLDIEYRVARIYRDARRIRSGGLYKDHLWFSMEKDHTEWQAQPGFFFEISPEGYSYGTGYFMAPASIMKSFRDKLDLNPTEFEPIAADLAASRTYKVYGEEYCRKKGEKDGVLGTWYNRKTLGVIAEYGGHDKLYKPKFAKTLVGDFAKLIPLYNFLLTL